MIRRGLQFLCGLVLLGAAPSFGQVADFPQTVVLQDQSFEGYNGVYQIVGVSGASSGFIFQRFASEGAAPAWYLMLSDNSSNANQMVDLYAEYPTSLNHASLRARAYVSGTNWPSSRSITFGGANGGSGSAGIMLSFMQPASEYEIAFPDWESAAVKIPLGFSFAMAFWGVAVAAAISMRWVKDLASAAS